MANSSVEVKKTASRKGAVRIADIPPDMLAELNAGRLETVTLAEWLAIDCRLLLRAVIPQAGLEAARETLESTARVLSGEGVMRRMRGMGEALFQTIAGDPRRDAIFETLATHPSDLVRSWAAYILAADPSLSLEDRLCAGRRFAADPHMAVRESAWDALRSYFVPDLERSFQLLIPWVEDQDQGVRRCAVEGTRPRGVWTMHIEALKRDPEPGLVLLERVRSDPSRYVQRAVANWLNDASKTNPAWVKKVCARWKKESKTAETAWTVNHALRSVRRLR